MGDKEYDTNVLRYYGIIFSKLDPPESRIVLGSCVDYFEPCLLYRLSVPEEHRFCSLRGLSKNQTVCTKYR